MKYSFLSPNLKYNNGCIYYLNMYELNSEDYKDNNYYIHENDMENKGFIECKDFKLDFNLVYSNFDDNIVIEMTSEKEISNEDLLRYVYHIQEKVKGCDVKDINKDYEKYHDIFSKFENNIIC